MKLGDKTKLALVKAAAKLTPLELIEAVEAEFAAMGTHAIARVVDWGVEGPRFEGLTNDWPPVGTVLYTIKRHA